MSRTALVEVNKSAPKGSHSFVNQAIIRLNNQEIENNQYVYISTAIQNSLEYSHDYSRNAMQYMFVQDTSEVVANNHGTAIRKAILPATARNRVTFNVKLPLSYVSNFFRTLDFPLINQLVEFDITYRIKNAIFREGAAVDVTINNTVLFLPVVELPREAESKFFKQLQSKSYKKSLIWYKLTNRVTRDHTRNDESDQEIEPSINGVKKLYCFARARFDANQEGIETISNIQLKNFNIVIDSEDFYSQNVQSDEEAYQLVSECFNMGGKDKNTGAILDFSKFRSLNRFYACDLSGQKVFESDPRKAQSIRFRGTPSVDCGIIFFLSQEKKTTIDFTDPAHTVTI